MRAQFPLDPSVSQFAAFVLSPHTAQVDAAIDHHRRRLAFDTEAALLAGIDNEAAVLDAAAAYTGGTPAQFALTDSTTMGLATMYGGLTLQPGDDVLSTTHDFYSTEASLRLLEQRTGAKVRRVTLYDDPATATVDSLASRLVAGDHRPDPGRGDHLGALEHRRAAAGRRDRGGHRRPQPHPGAPGPDRALRRRGARLRRRRRRPAGPGLRLPGHRHPQVAVRAARHRPGLVARLGSPDRDHPELLRPRRRAPAHRRRLPRLRAPLGARPGVRLPRPDRPVPGRGAHRRAGDAAQGGHRRDRRASGW